MEKRRQRDILTRSIIDNPIITLEDIPYRCNTVFNGAVVKFNGKYIMLLRVENLQGYSVILKAESEDGRRFHIEEKPCMEPSKIEPYSIYEERGLEDPRITYLEGEYYIMYTAVSRYGARIALAKTEDFVHFKRISIVSGPGNKDGVLFPRKIKDKYVRFDRPIGEGIGNIWLSYSDDLVFWGDTQLVAEIRRGYWDSFRIGASVPPIETKKGWLEIYHGVKMMSCGPIYRLGVFLTELNDPAKIIGRADIPILSPREKFERIGDVNNVVFSCGAVVEDTGEIDVYYGAADTSICLAKGSVQDLVDCCLGKIK